MPFLQRTFVLAVGVVAAAGCSSTSGNGACDAATGCAQIATCDGGVIPGTLTLTVSGYVSCTCLNGTFTLTQTKSDVWSSPQILGCPGQTTPAYFKLLQANPFALGVTSATSEPGSGNSDDAPANEVTCAPFTVKGGGSTAGNINAFCPGSEDEKMTWSIGE